jgi:MFS family permease
MLAFAAALIPAGSFGDVVGRKRLFLGGVAVFGLASLAAGVAQTPGELIAARIVQGTAAAAMTPLLLGTFRVIFSGRERGQAFGLYGAVLGFASAIGLLLGGALTEANLFGWQWRTVFLVNVPIALLSLVATERLVPETREASPGGRTSRAPRCRWPRSSGDRLPAARGAPARMADMGLGVADMGLGAPRRRRARRLGDRHAGGAQQAADEAPLLRPCLFKIPAFAAGMGVQLAFAAGLQGFFLIFSVWVQAGQHYSPPRAGLTTVASPLIIPLVNVVLVAVPARGRGSFGRVQHRTKDRRRRRACQHQRRRGQ